jgi:nucleotide-binding universal stress UspA family protein
MKIERVFVASDLSESSDEAICQGDVWAKAHGAKLTVGFVLPKFLSANPLFPQEGQGQVFDLLAAGQRASEVLSERTLELTGRSASDCRVVVTNGMPVAGILQAAKQSKADLLVVGPDSSDTASVAERVARHAHCPVLIARTSRPTGIVVAGTDLSDPSFTASKAALDFAKHREGRLTILHSVESSAGAIGKMFRLLGLTAPEPRNTVPEVRERLTAWAKEAGATEAEIVVLDGDAASALLRFASTRAAELVVIGTRGWSDEADLPLGSVAEVVVRSAACSVLVVRV